MGGKGRRKEKIPSKEVVFTKADESSSMLAPEITSDSESKCDSQEPLLHLPKLIGASPSSTSESLISLSDLTLNMADLTLDTPVPKKTRSYVKVSPAYVIKKKIKKSPAVKGLKRKIEIPSGTPPSSSQPSSSKATKQKTWFGPCKHCRFKNHLSDYCYSKPKCSTYGSTDHLTKEHLEHAAVKKTLSKLKAQSPLKPSPKKAPMIPKPFKECKYCGFNDHHSDHCEFYPGCEVCGSIAHEPSDYPKKHPNSRRPRIANKQSEPTKKKMENINEVRVKELRSDNGTDTKVNAINFNENGSFPDDEFLEPRSEVTQCPGNTKYFPYIPAYENTTPSESPILQVSVTFEDPPEFTKDNNHPALNEPDQAESADHFEPVEPQNNVIIKPISDVQPSPTIPPSADVILQTHVPQDRWSREKHIELVNIIGEPLAGITARSRIRDSDVASASECLYVNFLSEMEPKKLIKALEEEGWIIAMQEELTSLKETRLVSRGYNQQEEIDYEETFAPVVRLEATRIFLDYAVYMGFMVYQMDVKSAFFNGKISEEVYVQQPLGFESSEFPNHVCFQIKQDFNGISICQEKYVKDLLKKYDLADCASVKCPMLPPNNLGPDESGVSVNETLFRGMIRSLMYLTSSRHDIQFSTCLRARYQANPKESHFVAVKRILWYLKGTPNLSLWYPKGSGFDLKAYYDSDYAGFLWIKSRLADYDVLYDKVPIFCDNTSSIAISNNPVFHSRTKHIDIRYHFIRDHILKGDIELHFVPTDFQLVDIFTKPLVEPSFTRLVAELALTLQPSAMYVEYLKEFWYTAEVEDETKTITFSFSWWDKAMSFTQDEFISAIGLPICKDVVPLPPKETPVTQPKAPIDLKIKNKRIPPSSKPKSPYKVRVILPKKQVTETQHTKVTVAIVNATKSLVASELAEEQVNQPSATEAKKGSQWSTSDDNVIDITPKDNKERDAPDSGLISMPDDDLVSLTGFDSQALTDHDSKEGTVTFHASANMTAQSDPFCHLHEEMGILNTKIDQLERRISKKVVEDMKSFIPTIVADTLKEQLHEELPQVDAQIQKNLQAQLLDLLLKPIYKEFNAFNKLESHRFVLHQKELTKFLHNKMRKSIRLRVRTGMKEVCNKLFACTSTMATNSQHVRDLRIMFHDMVSLLSAAEVFQKTNTEGEKWEKNNHESSTEKKDAQHHEQTEGERDLGTMAII
ncbi:retrovirus-related pol polyprotein from transposon TNT 1-94 [Tanacetum coccineum]